MCIVCDARNDLLAICNRLDDEGQADLALKFRAFIEIVGSRTYDVKDAERNRSMKVEMFNLATQFAKGYTKTTFDCFAKKLNSFDLPKDEDSMLRNSMKFAMIDLFTIYGNRLPWALYGGYMFMVTRPNMHVAERLPNLKELLPSDLPWECVDAVWHGFPPATAIYLHILSIISKHTGTVPLHGCGCNHYLPPVRKPNWERTLIVYPQPEDIIEETEVPLSHCLNAIETLVQETFVLFGETSKSIKHQINIAPPVKRQAEV